MSHKPLKVAIAGIGGYGSKHHHAFNQLEKDGAVKVIATCDPRLEELTQEITLYELRSRQVALYRDFNEMISRHENELELVTLATPIHLHAAMHRACVERDIPCYVEKPPTLDPQELEAMIELDAKAKKQTQVGFSYLAQPYRKQLKERILLGEFGKVFRVTCEGCWPRPLSYYTRNRWAGRLMLEDAIILDSCTGNAMSHHLHNILFFAGEEGVYHWANPSLTEAELYRAYPIEGTDTIFAKGVLSNGIHFRIANTHASNEKTYTIEGIVCELATIEIRLRCGQTSESEVSITWRDGRLETFAVDRPVLKDHFLLGIDYLRNGITKRPTSRLADCRGLVELNALLYLAAKTISPIPSSCFSDVALGNGSTPDMLRCIKSIRSNVHHMIESGHLPSEQQACWARRGGVATREELPLLRNALREIKNISTARHDGLFQQLELIVNLYT